MQALTSFSFIDEPRRFSYTRKALCEVFGTVGFLCLTWVYSQPVKQTKSVSERKQNWRACLRICRDSVSVVFCISAVSRIEDKGNLLRSTLTAPIVVKIFISSNQCWNLRWTVSYTHLEFFLFYYSHLIFVCNFAALSLRFSLPQENILVWL